MRAVLSILLLTLAIAISGCATNDNLVAPNTPPTPEGNLAGQAMFTKEDFQSATLAPPWDVFNEDRLVLKATGTEDGTNVLFDHDPDSSQLTYEKAWVRSADGKWSSHTVTGTAHPLIDGFLSGDASLGIPAEDLSEGDNYVYGYFCTSLTRLPNGKFTYQCGCSDENTCGRWNVQRVTVDAEETISCGDGVCHETENLTACWEDCYDDMDVPVNPVNTTNTTEPPPNNNSTTGSSSGLILEGRSSSAARAPATLAVTVHAFANSPANSYMLSWGDGESLTFTNDDMVAGSEYNGRAMIKMDVSHTYEVPGSYDVRVTAYIPANQPESANIPMTVWPPLPEGFPDKYTPTVDVEPQVCRSVPCEVEFTFGVKAPFPSGSHYSFVRDDGVHDSGYIGQSQSFSDPSTMYTNKTTTVSVTYTRPRVFMANIAGASLPQGEANAQAKQLVWIAPSSDYPWPPAQATLSDNEVSTDEDVNITFRAKAPESGRIHVTYLKDGEAVSGALIGVYDKDDEYELSSIRRFSAGDWTIRTTFSMLGDDSAVHEVSLKASDPEPSADITSFSAEPESGAAPLNASFVFSANQATSYTLVFRQGQQTTGTLVAGESKTATHTYPVVGEYAPVLYVPALSGTETPKERSLQLNVTSGCTGCELSDGTCLGVSEMTNDGLHACYGQDDLQPVDAQMCDDLRGCWANNRCYEDGFSNEIFSCDQTQWNCKDGLSFDEAAGVCVEELAACENGVKDVGETDVDCGGDLCDPCDGLKRCIEDTDCISGTCNEGVRADFRCSFPGTCFDGLKNGNEVGVDCGGGCGACPLVSRFEATPTDGEVPFDATFTMDVAPDADEYTIAFGDGTDKSGTVFPAESPHKYEAVGEYTAVLTVKRGSEIATRRVSIVARSLSVCGDGVLNGDEECDGAEFAESMSCSYYDSSKVGDVTCTSDCAVSMESCYSTDLSGFPRKLPQQE